MNLWSEIREMSRVPDVVHMPQGELLEWILWTTCWTVTAFALFVLVPIILISWAV